MLFLSGCAVGPNYAPPETKVSGAFENTDDGEFSAEAIEVRWWQVFQDPQLNRLVEEAAKSNWDVAQALARIEEVRALRSQSILEGFPIVTSEASYTNTRLSEAEQGEFAAQAPRDFELYDQGFDATWELDFFGRVRRQVEARTALLQSLVAHRRDVLVSVMAEVARNYLELRGLQEQSAIVRRNAANQKKTLELTEQLLEAGRGTELDTSRAAAQYHNTLATVPLLETNIKRAVYRIAVLTARQPQALQAELLAPKPLPVIPALTKIGNPAALLQRRPDIRTAERELASRTAEVGVATADYFPRVRFNGNIALQANVLSGIGSAGSDAFSFGPVISWAAFDLGRVAARVRQADAQVDGQLVSYQQTVLEALEETENALTEHAQQKLRLMNLTQAAVFSQKAATLANKQFEAGLSDFLNVLEAESSALTSELESARTQTETATSLVRVYKALGGGWEVFPISNTNREETSTSEKDSKKYVTGPQPPTNFNPSK